MHKIIVMGLDSVELIMEIETAFKITILDSEVEKIFTVGDLYNCVWKHLQLRQTELCKTQMIFYRLKRYAQFNFGFTKPQLLLHINPNAILPVAQRQQHYQHMASALNLKLPPLRFSQHIEDWLSRVGTSVFLIALAVLGYYVFYMEYNGWWFALLLPLLLLLSFINQQLNIYRTQIDAPDLGSFTKKIFAINYTSEELTSTLSKKEAEILIKQIIVDKIGVDESEVIPSASLTDDLGVN
jgi:acyl carrier protein